MNSTREYNMEEKYIICEDSLEGILTAVYDAYALREGHGHIHIHLTYTQQTLPTNRLV